MSGHPEGLPDDHRELLAHTPMQPGFADVLLAQVLAQFGLRKYVLIAVGSCEHGHLHLETHSGGMEQDEVKQVLIDAAAAYDPDAYAGG